MCNAIVPGAQPARTCTGQISQQAWKPLHVGVYRLSCMVWTCAEQVLYETGYTYLDVRPELECDLVGKFKGSVNIPIMHATRKWSPEEQKKVVEKTENPDFVKMVRASERLLAALML